MTLRPDPYRDLETESTWRALDALGAAASARGVSKGALALAWVTSHPAVTAALVGPRSLEQFLPAVESLGVRLSAQDRADLAGAMERARAAI